MTAKYSLKLTLKPSHTLGFPRTMFTSINVYAQTYTYTNTFSRINTYI